MRELRKAKNMSLARFAAASGLSKGHVSNLENGLTVMSVHTAFASAQAFGIPPFVLVMFSGDERFSRILDRLIREAGGDTLRAAEALRELAFGKRRKSKRGSRGTRPP